VHLPSLQIFARNLHKDHETTQSIQMSTRKKDHLSI